MNSRFLNLLLFFLIMIGFLLVLYLRCRRLLLFLAIDLPLEVEAPLVAFLAQAVRVVLPVGVLAADLRLHSLSLADGLTFPRRPIGIILFVNALRII